MAENASAKDTLGNSSVDSCAKDSAAAFTQLSAHHKAKRDENLVGVLHTWWEKDANGPKNTTFKRSMAPNIIYYNE